MGKKHFGGGIGVGIIIGILGTIFSGLCLVLK